MVLILIIHYQFSIMIRTVIEMEEKEELRLTQYSSSAG